VAHEGLLTLLACLEVLRPGLTSPSFTNLVVLVAGWVRTSGTHAVTQALVETAVAGRRHHEAFHRFFSRGTWSPDELGRLLFQALAGLMPDDGVLRIVVDDTLAPKKGPHVFGLGCHLDAVRSTRRHKVFSFGHCWVTLAVLLPMPFSKRTWALPVLFRLHRNEKECKKKSHPYRKKTELARELVDTFVRWAGDRRIELSADSAYCNDTVTRGLAKNVALLGAMRPDAVLTEPPPTLRRRQGGRPAVRGETLPKPKALAMDERQPWQYCEALLYGKQQRVAYKTCVAQWYRACGGRLLRVVVVRAEEGSIEFRVFFSTDPTLSVQQILEGYARRWAIEVCFRDLKQLLGFADSSARKRAAVERVAPFVGLSYTALVLWFAQGAYRCAFAKPPLRPWYPHKTAMSFADILRAAQRVLATVDVLDLASELDNLRETRADRARPSAPTRRRAA
jgi:SRSO17 transposase